MIELVDELVLNQIYHARLNKCPQCGSIMLPSPQQVEVCIQCGCVGLQKEFHPANRKYLEVN